MKRSDLVSISGIVVCEIDGFPINIRIITTIQSINMSHIFQINAVLIVLCLNADCPSKAPAHPQSKIRKKRWFSRIRHHHFVAFRLSTHRITKVRKFISRR